MKEYMVSLDIVTEKMSSEAFHRLSGLDVSRLAIKDCGDRLCWQVHSSLGETAPLPAQIEDVWKQLEGGRFPLNNQPGLESVCLNIGVLYDTACGTAMLPYESVALAGRMGAGIEVSCYPVTEE